MARVVIVALAALAVAVVAVPDGRASLHQPKEGLDLPVDARGAPVPLPHPEFKRRLLVLRNVANPAFPLAVIDPNTKEPRKDPKTGEPVPTERGVVLKRIADARKLSRPTAEQKVALAVDLLRVGQPVEAEGALAGERRGFLPNITLAHIAVVNRDWAKAFDHLDIANGERSLPPAASLGLTPQQFAWQVQLNRGPLAKLVQSRWKESRGPKQAPEDETPDSLFPTDYAARYRAYEPVEPIPAAGKTPADLVVALGERIVWQSLRAAELAQPIAAAQQLVLWFPQDARLFWLLGELYAAAGRYVDAQAVFDESTWSLQYGNRKLLRQHREFVAKPAEEQRRLSAPPADEQLDFPPEPSPSETPDTAKPETPHVAFTMKAVWIYIGVVATVAVLVLVRTILKRRSR